MLWEKKRFRRKCLGRKGTIKIKSESLYIICSYDQGIV